MAPSSGTFVIEGVKLSIDMLKEISGDLPPPTSTVVGLVQQIIAIVEVRPGAWIHITTHQSAVLHRPSKTTRSNANCSSIACFG